MARSLDDVFIYWDNSNVFIEAQSMAEERNGGENVRARVRLDFQHVLQLAAAGRHISRAIAAGSVPPELQVLWKTLQAQGVEVKLFHRYDHGERNVPDLQLQRAMYQDCTQETEPATCILISGDGGMDSEGEGFLTVLQDVYARGWRVEVLSWTACSAYSLRKWANTYGLFIPLERFYLAITFLEPNKVDGCYSGERRATEVDLTQRPLEHPPRRALPNVKRSGRRSTVEEL